MGEQGNETAHTRGKFAFRVVCALAAILLGVLAVRMFAHLGDDDLRPLALPSVATNAAPSSVEPPRVAASNAVSAVSPVVTNVVRRPPPVVVPVTNSAPKPVPVRLYPTNVPPARQVRLANRTRVVEKYRRAAPKKFAARQTPTARGTVPYVVVSELPVSEIVRARATKLGACVLGYVPVNAMLVEVNEKALKRLVDDVLFTSVYELEPVDKVQRRVWEQTTVAPTVDVSIVPLTSSDLKPLAAFIQTKGGQLIDGAGDSTRTLRATVPAKVVDELAGRGEVRWIESFARPKLQNNCAVNAGEMNVRAVWETHGLTGEGQIVSISDSGLDTGNLQTLMKDFKGRVLGIRNVSYAYNVGFTRYTVTTDKKDTSGHGTHTAGSIVGTGALSNGEIRGVAPDAKLFMTGVLYDGYVYFNSFSSLFQPSSSYSASIHSASWGDDLDNSYNDWCAEVDEYVWKHPTFLPVFSAGNTGTDVHTVGTPGTAKNCLTVGATENVRTNVLISSYADNAAQIAYFSSCGPTADGRIKPEICAPGTYILSTRSTLAPDANYGWGVYSNTNYAFNGGTSMACPLVAGAAALTRQWLVTRRGFVSIVPTAALLKAVLTGGAHDLEHEPGTDCGGAAPNHRQGWGLLNLGESLFPSNRVVSLRDRIPFAQGSDEVLRVTVTNAAPLDVQLVWIDYPATAGTATALVNDLDLVVSNETTGVVWRGNGVAGGDRTNTVESVRLAMAQPGTYAVHVKGVRVPYDSTKGGAAALYLRGAFNEESTVVPTEFPLRLQSYFPLLNDWGTTETTWYPSGTVARVTVPNDLPDGGETLSNLVWTDDATGVETYLDDQVLAEIEVAAADQTGTMQYDARGQMARTFDVLVDAAKDVRFHYYSVTNINVRAGLPDWWWRRMLRGATGDSAAGRAAGDADGDGVTNLAEYRADTDPLDAASQLRILAFSSTNIVWRGGRACTQVVERAENLAKEAVWTGVYTNVPPTATETSRPIAPSGSRTFYRVRALGR